MPNPTRPIFGEVIDETWGDLVADHVVRQYANAAERDADFAGFAPADLQGQLVGINPPPPVINYLQQHDGTAWHPRPIVRAIRGSGLTDAYSQIQFAFGITFPGTPVVVASPSAQNEDGSGGGAFFTRIALVTPDHVVITILDTNGNAVAGGGYYVASLHASWPRVNFDATTGEVIEELAEE
jgi:hypothetical protein